MNGQVQLSRDLRRILYSLVDDVLDQRALIETSQPSHQRQADSRELTRRAVDLAATLCGPLVAMDICSVPASDDRGAALAALQARLQIVAPLLTSNSELQTIHPSSIASAIAETHGLRSGDTPKLFATLKGRKVGWRLRVAKWRALYLDALGEGLGVPTAERHKTIAEAFIVEWDTIRHWLDQRPRSTPSGRIRVSAEDELNKIRRQGQLNRQGLTYDDWRRAVQAAAELYRSENRAER